MPNRHNAAFFLSDMDHHPSPATNTPLRHHQPSLETGMLSREAVPYPIGVFTGEGLGTTQSSSVAIGPVLPTQPFGEAELSAQVNVSSGNLFVQTAMTYFLENGRLFSAGFIYNSMAATRDTAFTFSLDRRIDPLTLPISASIPVKKVVLRAGDGSVVTYLPHPTVPNLYFAPGCGHGTPFISYDTALKQTVHHHPGTGISTYFNAQGECVRERDSTGHDIEFEYINHPIKGQPRLLSAFYRSGSDTRYILQTVVLPNNQGRTVTLLQRMPNTPDQILQQNIFDNVGCMVQTDIPSANGLRPYRLNFRYANFDGMRAYLINVTQSDGTQMTFDFEPSPPTPGGARRLAACNLGDLGLLGNAATRFTYDSPTSVTMKDSMGLTTVFGLDGPSRRLVTQTHYTTPKTLGSAPREITRYTYTESGQLASLTTARGGQTQYEYNNVYGLCTRVTGPDHQVTAYTYSRGDLPDPVLENGFDLQENPTTSSLVFAKHSPSSDLSATFSHVSFPVFARSDSDAAILENGFNLAAKAEDKEEAPLPVLGRRDLEHAALLDDFTRRPCRTSMARYAVGDPLRSAKATRYVYSVEDVLASKHFVRFMVSPTGCVTAYEPDSNGYVGSERLYYNAAFNLAPYPIPGAIPAMASIQNWLAQPDQHTSRTALTTFTYEANGSLGRSRQFTAVDAQGAGIENAGFGETTYGRDGLGRIVTLSTREQAETPLSSAETAETKEEKEQALAFGEASIATTRYQRDGLNRVTKIEDPLGNKVSTVYGEADHNGRSTLTRTHPNGRREITVRDSRGAVVETREEVTASDGTAIIRSTRYWNDATNLCAVTTLPDQSLRISFFDGLRRPIYEISHTGRVLAYRYHTQHGIQSVVRYDKTIDPSFDAFWPMRDSWPSLSMFEAVVMPPLTAGNPLIQHRITDTSGRLHYVIDKDGSIKALRYDSLNRPVAEIEYDQRITQAELRLLLTGIAFPGPMPSEKDRITLTQYDENTAAPVYLALPLAEDAAVPAGAIARQDGGYITRYQRDAGGRAIGRVQYHTPLPVNVDSGIPLDEIVPHPEDAYDVFTQDGRHQCIQEVDPDHFVKTHRYFASGERAQTTQQLSSSHPLCEESTTEGAYNTQTTSYSYDLRRQLVDTTNTQQRAQQTVYDEMGQPILVSSYDITQPNRTHPDTQREIHTRYNGFGQIIAQTNAVVSAKLRDIALDDSLPPDEKERRKAVLWQTETTRHVYDPATGLKQSSTNPLGQTTYYYYDRDHALRFQIGTGFEITEFTPDVFDRVIFTRRYFTPVPILERPQLRGGFLTPALTQMLQSLQTPTDACMARTFDEQDRVLTEVDAEGVTTARTYDAFGDCVTEDLPGKDKETQVHITHTFDARGLEILTTRESGTLKTAVSREYHSLHGLETSRTDERGEHWQTTYHRRPLIKSTTDPTGASESKDYDGLQRIATETDALGAKTIHLYDEPSRTHEIRGPVPAVFTQTTQNVFGESVTQKDALGTTHIQHAHDGQVAAVTDPLAHTTAHQFNLMGLKTQTTLPNGTVNTFAYDDSQRLIKTTEDTNGLARTETIDYLDPLGQRVYKTNARGVIRIEERDRRGLLTRVTTDPDGLALQETFAYSPARTQTYHSQGDAQHPEQACTEYKNDDLNRRVATIVDPNHLALQTRLSLDAAGLVRQTIDPMGYITWIFYDANGRPVITLDPMGGIEQTRYDANGNPVQTRRYMTSLSPEELAEITLETPTTTLLTRLAQIASPEDIQIYHFYDDNQRLTFKVTGKGKLVQTTYNAAHCPIQIRRYATRIDPKLIPTLTTDELTRIAAELRDDTVDNAIYQYFDAAKQLRYQIDLAGYVTEKRYRETGECIATIQYSTRMPESSATFSHVSFPVFARSDSDAAIYKKSTYPEGQPTWSLEEIAAQLRTHPEEDRATLTFFDALSQPYFVLTPADGTSATGLPLYQVKRITHDAVGHQVALRQYATLFPLAQVPQTPEAWQAVLDALRVLPTDPNKDRVEQAEFDQADRKVAEVDALTYRETDTLDALGRVTAHTNKAGHTTHKDWDSAGRMTAERSPAVPVGPNGDMQRIETRYTHDTCDRVLTCVVGNGQPNALETANTYNPCGQLTKTTVSRGTALASGPASTTLFYRNAQQRIIATQHPSGSYTFNLYDADETLSFTIDGTGAVIAYATNGVGDRIVQRTYANRLPQALRETLTQYAQAGRAIPLSLVSDAIVPSDDDGLVLTDFNNRREAIRTRTLALPGTRPPANPQAPIYRIRETEYTPFGEIKAEREPLSHDPDPLERLHLFHYNRAGLPDTECTPEGRVIRTQYSFQQPCRQTIRATPPEIVVSADTSVAALDAAHVPSTTDQTFEWQHDQRGQVTEHKQIDVQVQALAEDKNEPCGYRIIDTTVDLTTTYTYDAVEQETSTAQPNGGRRLTYRDALGRTIAEVDVSRPVRREDGSTVELMPLTTTHRNLHGTAIEVRVHAQGLTQVDPDVLPTLPNSPNDRVTRFITDGLNRVVAKSVEIDAPSPLVFAEHSPSSDLSVTFSHVSSLVFARSDSDAATQAIYPEGQPHLLTETRYSPTHRIAATIDAAGFISRTFYDEEDRPCILVDALGGVILTEYDAFGRPVCVSKYGSPLNPDELKDDTTTEAVRAKIAQLPQNGISLSRTFYDPSGLVRFTVHAVDTATYAVTEQRYDLGGFSWQTTAYYQPARAMPDTLHAAITWVQNHARPELDATTTTLRDSAGRACFIADPKDYVTEQDFNAHNKITRSTKYAQRVKVSKETLATATVDTFPALLRPDPQQDTVYNATYNGQLEKEFEIFGEENVTRKAYDVGKNLIATLEYATPFPKSKRAKISLAHREATHEAGWVWADEEGNTHNLSDESSLQQTSTDIEAHLRAHPRASNDRVKTHVYNLAHQATQTTDTMGNSEHFGQDIFGNRIFTRDRNGQPWYYTVDRANRLVQTQAPPTLSTEIAQQSDGTLRITSERMVCAVSIRVLDPRGLPVVCIEGALPATPEASISPGELLEKRLIAFSYHPVSQEIIETRLPDQYVDNPNAPANFANRPETKVTITTKKHYDTKLALIAEENADGGIIRYQRDLSGEITRSIDARNAVVDYRRDPWGRILQEQHYATPLQHGNNPTPSPDDLILTYGYDERGQRIKETTQEAFYAVALPAQAGALKIGTASASTHFEYRFDGQCIREMREYLSPTGSLQYTYTFKWFNRNRQLVAIVLPNGAVTFTAYNDFGEVVQRTEYATPATLNDLPPINRIFDPQPLSQQPHDRVYIHAYDLLGRQTLEQRPHFIWGADATGLKTGLWERSYQYASPTATQDQPSAIRNEEGQWEYRYYDARERLTAVRGITFTAHAAFGAQRTTPLTFKKYNASGESVGEIQFANGMNSATDPRQYPVPLQPNPATDVVTLTLRNTRGEAIVTQDAENHPTAMTYTSIGKPARSFYRLTHPITQLDAAGQPVMVPCTSLRSTSPSSDLSTTSASSSVFVKYLPSSGLSATFSHERRRDVENGFDLQENSTASFPVFARSDSDVATQEDNDTSKDSAEAQQFSQPVVNYITYLDERRFTYDLNGNPLSCTLLRNNTLGDPENDCTLTQYDCFNRPIFEGSPSQPKASYKRYDPRGRLWSANPGGMSQIYLYNLDGSTGQETARLSSATQALAHIRYEGLSSLIQGSSYEDLEIDAFVRRPGDALPTQHFSPTYNNQVDKPPIDTLPISVSVQHLPWPNTPSTHRQRRMQTPAADHDLLLDERGHATTDTTLAWPLPQKRNISGFRFTLIPVSDPTRPIILPVVTKEETCFVDVSASRLPTDQYAYRLEAFEPNPLNTTSESEFHDWVDDEPTADPPLSYQAHGKVQFITDVTQGSTHIVPNVVGTRVVLYGNHAEVARVRLLTPEGIPVLETNVTPDPDTGLPSVDLSDQASGDYILLPLSSTGAPQPQTLPFRIHTLNLSPTPLSREIPCSTQLRFFDTFGELTWTLPDDLQPNLIRVTVQYYTLDQSLPEVDTFELDQTTDHGEQTDADGNTLQCNLAFSKPVDTIIALTLAVSVPYQASGELKRAWVTLRREEFPLELPAHIEALLEQASVPMIPASAPASVASSSVFAKHSPSSDLSGTFSHERRRDVENGFDIQENSNAPSPVFARSDSDAATQENSTYPEGQPLKANEPTPTRKDTTTSDTSEFDILSLNNSTIQTAVFLDRDLLHITPLSGFQDDNLPALSVLDTSLDLFMVWKLVETLSANEDLGLVVDMTPYPNGIYPLQILKATEADAKAEDESTAVTSLRLARGGTIYPSDNQPRHLAAHGALRYRTPLFSAPAAFAEQLIAQQARTQAIKSAILTGRSIPPALPESPPPITTLTYTPFSAAETAALATIMGKETVFAKGPPSSDLSATFSHTASPVFARSDSDAATQEKPNTPTDNTKDLIRPSQSFTYDTFGNPTAQTDPLGNRTQKQYGGFNQCISMVQPAVTVVNERGEARIITPTTYFTVNFLNSPRTETNPKGHTKVWTYDEANQRTTTLLGDGTVHRISQYDALSRQTAYVDARMLRYIKIYDRRGLIIRTQTPLRLQRREYNELGYTTADINPIGATQRYAYTVGGHVSISMDPLGYQTLRTPDRHGLPLYQRRADGATSHTARDYFGRVTVDHTFSGEMSRYTYDHKTQCVQVFTSYPNQQDRYTKSWVKQRISVYDRRTGYQTYTAYLALPFYTREQVITSTYHAGRLVALNDSGRKLVMQFGNNLANQRVTERTLTYDGRLVQSATDRLNALGDKTSSTDPWATLATDYDDARNRRKTVQTVTLAAPKDRVITFTDWNDFDNAERVVHMNAALQDGTLTRGTRLVYQSNLRIQEVTAGGTRHLGYDLDGRLTTMTAAHAAFTRKLREDGYVTQYDELKSGKLTSETSWLNIGGWLEAAHQTSGEDWATSVFSGYTPIGLFTQQRTTYSGEGNNRDDIYYFYMTYVNATLQRHVLGTRTNDHGQSTSSMTKLFYTDGSPNAVSANLRETFFETAPDGRVLTAWRTQWARLPSLIFPMQLETGVTRFLYEVNAGAAHVLGSYSSSMVSTPYGSNGLRWLLQDGSTRSAFMLAGGFRPQHPIQMVSSTYPPQAPESCVAGPGDSYTSLSIRHFGDASYADLIEEENKFMPIVPGQSVSLPQLITAYNSADTSFPYDLFVNALMRKFVLVLNTPQPPPPPKPKKRGFFLKIIRAIENIIAIVVGVLLAPIIGPGSIILAQAAITMAIDASFQAINLVIGLDDTFSVQEMIAIGISAGIAAYAKGSLLSNHLFEQLLAASKLAITQQAIELSLGIRKEIDLTSIILSVTQRMIQIQTDLYLPTLDDAIAKGLRDTFTNTLTNVVLARAVGYSTDIEDIVANFIGSTIGTQLGNQIQAYADTWQNKASREADMASQRQQQEQAQAGQPGASTGHTKDKGDDKANTPATTSRTQSTKQQTVERDVYAESLMHHAVAQMGGDFDDYTRILMHEMLIDTYQQPNPNAHQETTHPPKPTKTELPETDLFTQALIQDAVNLYGGTFESNLHSEMIGQLALAQQANTQATTQPTNSPTASPPMSFIDYVKAVNDSAFIAHFNRQMASIVHMSVGDFWNGMQASSQAIVAPDTSIWGRAGHTALLALDAATVLPLVGPAARVGSVAIRGTTSAVKSSYAASAMLLNEASTLRAADMALSGAAAAAQPKTGFQAALGIIDAPTTAASSLSNAGLMKSVGLFGREGIARVEGLAQKDPLINVLKDAKPILGKANQLETTLPDGTKVIFRRDVGEHAHPIGKAYKNPIDHYNIEVHTPHSSRPGKYIPEQNAHVIVDQQLKPIEIILKNKSHLENNLSINRPR